MADAKAQDKAGPSRGAAPRPRRRRAGLRGLDRWPPGSFAIRLVYRERRVADLRRDHLQPSTRRRVPGLPVPRQGSWRHHPRRPDRRRRPPRPPRPQPADPAPAAVLAPRKRMDGPVRSRLRPARPDGLTSPDTVTGPAPPGTNATADPERGTRTSRRTVSGKKSTPARTTRSASSGPRGKTARRIYAVDRGLAAIFRSASVPP